MCSNSPCPKSASSFYYTREHQEGVATGKFFLCDTCAEAFWLGQAQPWATLRDLNGEPFLDGEDDNGYMDEGDDMCDICMRSGVSVLFTARDGRTVCADCSEDFVDDSEEGSDE